LPIAFKAQRSAVEQFWHVTLAYLSDAWTEAFLIADVY
jgi:hypothetical protein